MKSVRKVVKVFLFILVGGLTLNPIPARADAAPPAPPPGYNLKSGEELTNVQMIAEQVVIEVGGQGKIDIDDADPNYGPTFIQGYTARVTATFWMQNQGQEDELLAVRFPIKTNDGYYRYVPVQNFQVKVNGAALEWSEDSEPDPAFDMYWAHFDVAFPVGQEVLIEISYSTVSYTDNFQATEQFSYILETGAGWYGPIGHGEIILRLPYTATHTNLLLDDSTPGASLIGREVRWEFDDLEPSREDNWRAEIISPDHWQAILDSQQDLAKNPDDLDALLSLGQAAYDATVYQKVDIVTSDSPDIWNLFLLGEDSLARAVSLAPNNTDIRITYTEHLLVHAQSWQPEFTPPSADLIQEQLDALTGVELDEDTQWLVDSLTYHLPTLSAPTKTPSPSPTLPPPTTVPSSTPTPVPPPPTPTSQTGEETQADTPSTSGQDLPAWVILLLIALTFGAGILVGRRRSP